MIGYVVLFFATSATLTGIACYWLLIEGKGVAGVMLLILAWMLLTLGIQALDALLEEERFDRES